MIRNGKIQDFVADMFKSKGGNCDGGNKNLEYIVILFAVFNPLTKIMRFWCRIKIKFYHYLLFTLR